MFQPDILHTYPVPICGSCMAKPDKHDIYDACGKSCSDVLHPPPTQIQLIGSKIVKWLVFGLFPLLVFVGSVLIRTRTIANRRTTFGDIIVALIITPFLVDLAVGASSVTGGWPFAMLFLAALAFMWSRVITGSTDEEREWARRKAKQRAEERMEHVQRNQTGGAGSF
jgi:hypothetical protein